MSEEDRKTTVQLPAAANIALFSERLSALERRFEAGDQKLDRVLQKLDALHALNEQASKDRESGDQRLGRSLDRIDEKVMVIARDAEKQVNAIGEVRALAMAAVDGVEDMNRKLAALQSHGVESAPHAKPAE